MPQITLTSGHVFTGASGSSLLDAATRAGVILPYSCKSGRCSACKCKVVSGQTRGLYPDSGLTEREKLEGWILSCVTSAESDLNIEVDDWSGVVLPSTKIVPCRVSHLKILAPDVIQVNLRLPPTADFNFLPGQYIDVIGVNGIRRSYSIANSSFQSKLLELHIRAVEGGIMSEYWFKQAKVNDLLRLNGPLGTFFLRDDPGADLVFIATGTGIAPVKAMLESLSFNLTEQSYRSVTVLWGGRVSTDLYFDVARIAGKFKYVPVLSRADTSWSGARGYVQDELIGLFPDLGQAVVYACGSNSMIHGAKEILTKKGLSNKRFYSDAFVSSGFQ